MNIPPESPKPEIHMIRRRRSTLGSAWKLLTKAPPSAWFGLTVIAIYLIVALFAPLLAPYGESQVVSSSPYETWSYQYILGTDQLGRDMLSRLIFGARNTIGIAFATTALAFLMGGSLGMLSGLLGGTIDQILSRIVDAVMSIPTLIFILIILSIVGSSVLNLTIIISSLSATYVFRLTRAVAKNIAVMDFVEEARLRGEGIPWIIRKEILPNILPTLVAEFGMRFCFVFLTIAALSFLGLGIQPPTADWGSMVRESSTLIAYGDITPLLPAGAIALLTIAVNNVVDWFVQATSGLRD